VYAQHPGRFGLIKPFDPRSAAVAEEVAEWARTPGVVGARLLLTSRSGDVDDPGLNRILAAGATAGIPVNVLCWGNLALVRELARRHPNTQVVVDHVGLRQPFAPPVPPEPFAEVAAVVALAACDNVALKISGACTLSQQPFPYPDIWEPLGQIFAAFGFDRCLWGTDWTRAVNLLTYAQGVEAFRVTDQLSEAERAALMGGSLAKIYHWAPDVGE
jgi:L-fuconolactonase